MGMNHHGRTDHDGYAGGSSSPRTPRCQLVIGRLRRTDVSEAFRRHHSQGRSDFDRMRVCGLPLELSCLPKEDGSPCSGKKRDSWSRVFSYLQCKFSLSRRVGLAGGCDRINSVGRGFGRRVRSILPNIAQTRRPENNGVQGTENVRRELIRLPSRHLSWCSLYYH